MNIQTRRESDSSHGGVVFIFDRVMHYHRNTRREIARRLSVAQIPFHVLSAKDKVGAVGRVADPSKVVDSHANFALTEKRVLGFDLRYQHGLNESLDKILPTVVVSTCHPGSLSEWKMLAWARRRKVRRVAWQCGYEYNPGRILKQLALDRFIPQFNFHLCYHSHAQEFAIRHGADLGQTLVMHNTIDERNIISGNAQQAKAELVKRFSQLEGKAQILYVGAVLAEKRLELVFDALEKLNRKDVMFVVVGDGPHLATLKQQYANRKDWLSVGRVVEGVGTYFDAADVFVLPGTGGLAINEAMAYRLPVISGYADGSTDDLVVDGVTGFRLREESAAELADRLREVLVDPARATAMGAAGEKRIRGELSFVSFIDRVVGVLVEQHAQALKVRDK